MKKLARTAVFAGCAQLLVVGCTPATTPVPPSHFNATFNGAYDGYTHGILAQEPSSVFGAWVTRQQVVTSGTTFDESDLTVTVDGPYIDGSAEREPGAMFTLTLLDSHDLGVGTYAIVADSLGSYSHLYGFIGYAKRTVNGAVESRIESCKPVASNAGTVTITQFADAGVNAPIPGSPIQVFGAKVTKLRLTATLNCEATYSSPLNDVGRPYTINLDISIG